MARRLGDQRDWGEGGSPGTRLPHPIGLSGPEGGAPWGWTRSGVGGPCWCSGGHLRGHRVSPRQGRADVTCLGVGGLSATGRVAGREVAWGHAGSPRTAEVLGARVWRPLAAMARLPAFPERGDVSPGLGGGNSTLPSPSRQQVLGKCERLGRYRPASPPPRCCRSSWLELLGASVTHETGRKWPVASTGSSYR